MKSFRNQSQWILNATADSLFIVGPPFIILLMILLFPHYFDEVKEVNPMVWFIVVLGVDVSHVYSTLYRTYFEPSTFHRHRNLLLLTPAIVWMVGVLCYSVDHLLFWRIMAYLAVFHFIRQQYGFLRIYVRKEERPRWFVQLETSVIYAVTGIPVLIWHLSADRVFVWFVPDDFLITGYAPLVPVLKVLLFAVIVAYTCCELYFVLHRKVYNTAKYLLISGTFVSWYFGIVYFNSDLIFTLFNVICHGIPYMALIWIYGNKKSRKDSTVQKWYALLFSYRGILFYAFTLLLLAYLEEGFWNALVWRDHDPLFSFFSELPDLGKGYWTTLLVPLLSVPQVTHYVIDGFIWKIRNDQYDWKAHTLNA